MNESTSSSGGDDSTVAQTLASGSQDIAALAGLFATDGVERNALASETGYGTVISSTFSILGVLGLVKSSVKLALGANKCRKSGWGVEPMRGIFGYENDETDRAVGIGVLDVLLVSIEFNPDVVRITKKKRRFDTDKVPQLKVGEDTFKPEHTVEPNTIINLGNMLHDRMFSQRPLIIILLALLCSGATSWLILVVENYPIDAHYWVFHLATTGFQFSLLAMIAPTLYHSYLTTRPSQYLTPRVWDILTRRHDFDKDPYPPKIVFLRRQLLDGTQVLSFRGDFGDTGSLLFQAFMFAMSALCVVGYICQYTLLKLASDRASSIWIGLQAAFALLRALFWILDPPFDDPKTMEAELIGFGNNVFDEFSLMRLVTEFMDEVPDKDPSTTYIPMWAFRYLQRNSMSQIIQECKRYGVEDFETNRPSLATHRSGMIRHSYFDYLDDPYVPRASLTNLMLDSAQCPLEDKARFDLLDFRLVLHRTTSHEPIKPGLVFAVEYDRNVGIADLSKQWIRWPSQTQLEKSSASATKMPLWSRDRAVLRSVTNKQGSFRNTFDWYRAGETEVPAEMIADFYHFNLEETEKERRPNAVGLRLDLTNIPLPRSYALSLSLDGHRSDSYTPANWLADSLKGYRKTAAAVRKNKTFHAKGKEHEGEKERRYDAIFPDSESLLSFSREYIGLTEEISCIWQLLWVTRLHLPSYLVKHKFKQERLPSLARPEVNFYANPTFGLSSQEAEELQEGSAPVEECGLGKGQDVTDVGVREMGVAEHRENQRHVDDAV